MTEFTPFPKMARFSRDVVVTEKIDGTNASIFIGKDGEFLVGSRTKWITPENDNAGFARWAYEHKEELMQLGPGHHFGEWWGNGIQRKYGLPNGDKRFSLFNTIRWRLHGTDPEPMPIGNAANPRMKDELPACVGLVPELWFGNMDDLDPQYLLDRLQEHGSMAAPGFMNPEGIVIYHIAAGVGFKKTIEKDDTPKSLA